MEGQLDLCINLFQDLKNFLNNLTKIENGVAVKNNHMTEKESSILIQLLEKRENEFQFLPDILRKSMSTCAGKISRQVNYDVGLRSRALKFMITE
jgi:hypothetical protein